MYLPTAYGSLAAFFLLGAALIAAGLFLSSLTENQGLAAGLGIAVILFNYFSVSLSESVSSTAFGTVIALFVLAVLLSLVVWRMTGSASTAYAFCLVLCVALVFLTYLDSSMSTTCCPR